MLLVIVDLFPDAWEHSSHRRVVAGTGLCAALMLAFGAVLGV